MNKELHIWLGEDCSKVIGTENLYLTIESTENALLNEEFRIHTVQPHFCSTDWIVKGYRVFVHMIDNEIVEMKLGKIGDNPKEIRVEHNLERMLFSGCFGKVR